MTKGDGTRTVGGNPLVNSRRDGGVPVGMEVCQRLPHCGKPVTRFGEHAHVPHRAQPERMIWVLGLHAHAALEYRRRMWGVWACVSARERVSERERPDMRWEKRRPGPGNHGGRSLKPASAALVLGPLPLWLPCGMVNRLVTRDAAGGCECDVALVPQMLGPRGCRCGAARGGGAICCDGAGPVRVAAAATANVRQLL